MSLDSGLNLTKEGVVLSGGAGKSVGIEGPFRFNVNGIVAAAGSAIGDASQLGTGMCPVSTDNAAKGVKLPEPTTVGEIVLVINTAAATALELYPAAGDTINGESAGTPFTIAAKGLVLCVADTLNSWRIAELAVAAV